MRKVSEMELDLTTNNLPPQNLEAEQAVLGSILFNNEAMATALTYLLPSDFYRRAHQILFEVMVELNNDNKAIDVITLQTALTAKDQIADIGGIGYLSELALAVPTAANIEHYAKIVKDKALTRNLIATATNIISQASSGSEAAGTLIEEAERQIMQVSESHTNSGFTKISNVLDVALNNIEKLSDAGEEITGLATGYYEFDKMTAGLQPDNLMILAARPGVGKTAFALNIAQNVGKRTDKAIALFSLEMSAESLVNRMLCAEGSIDANHLRTGQLNNDEWNSLMVANGSLSATNIYIDDTPGIKMAQISAQCRRLAKETDLGLIVIDYLQLIESGRRENRQQEVSEISRQLKKLAKELSVPVIALSQLSRGVEQRQDKRPILSDIRESGSIEQDADIVAFLYRDDYYRSHNEDEESGSGPRSATDNNMGEVELIIEKNRSGARGTVKLLFIKSYNKFSSISYAPEPGMPTR